MSKSENSILVGISHLTDEEMQAIDCPYSTVEVKVRYHLGGYGGFDWKYQPRSYQLSITPYEQLENGMRKSTLYGGWEAGGFIPIEEVSRKSQKRMRELADKVDLSVVKNAWLKKDVAALQQAARA